MAEFGNRLLSNRVVGIAAVMLATVILLDGRLYNRQPTVQGIYSLNNPNNISISQDNQIIMAFEHSDKQWLMVTPTSAPLNAERIKVLLDSNNQTSRSYAAADLPLNDLFPHPVDMQINGKSFQLGDVEPVSKQRYVLANGRVYLQADHVIPLIRAGSTPFLDLTITQSVTTVEIDQQAIESPGSWSSLKALGIVPRNTLNTDPTTTIHIKQNKHDDKTFQLHLQDGVAILASPVQQFGFLISVQQAEKLGLSPYL